MPVWWLPPPLSLPPSQQMPDWSSIIANPTLNLSGGVTFYSPLSDVPPRTGREGSSSRTRSLSLPQPPSPPPISPHSLLSLLFFGCPCECPGCNGCFTAPAPALSPFQGSQQSAFLMVGGREKAFPAPRLTRSPWERGSRVWVRPHWRRGV